ncbi:MAG: redox-sensing transcriptional repressor Rex [Clostridia bacterium]|nr:redox-sensing transcriptional repressor Rex [Clostridia bacterium]MDD4047450.1 redox-sensing transcriptional repressor Rex [Clostridia bacterium]
MKSMKIPEATVLRLSIYSRYLKQLWEKGVTNVSSGEIAEGVNGTSAQVRKDLAYFGEFGTRGVGYKVRILDKQITEILGINNEWEVVIVGAGNLGSALTHYKGFKERRFNIQAVFDNDENKIGSKINDVLVYSITDMDNFIKENDIQIGIVAVPATYAQGVVDILIKAGIKSILNFAPTVISVPEHVEHRSVDLVVNLEVLTYNLVNKK